MKDYKNKWVLPDQDDDFLKNLSKDIFNGLVFTDRSCNGNLTSVFMCMLFMGPKEPTKPKYKSDFNTVDGKRDNILFDLVERETLEASYNEDMKFYEEELTFYKDSYLTSIGMVYEYMENAGPTSINGLPCFMSLRMINKKDSDKLSSFYEEYKSLRETVDAF